MSEKFSIPRLFQEAHPNIPDPFTAEDKAYLKQFEEYFHRCLFAITHRKSLEYKIQLGIKGKEAVKRLMAIGWDEYDAEKFVGLAIKELGTNAPPEEIVDKAEQLKDQAVEGGTAFIAKSPSMKDAELALTSPVYKMNSDVAKGLVKKAAAIHGADASTELLTASALEISKGGPGNSPKVMSLGGATKPTPTATAPTPPVAPAAPAVPPTPSAPIPSAPVSKEDAQLEGLNKKLTELGIETLSSVAQMKSFHSLKGQWKALMNKKAGDLEDPSYQAKIVPKDSQIGPEHKEIVQGMIAKIKTKPSVSEFINPFVASNFVL